MNKYLYKLYSSIPASFGNAATSTVDDTVKPGSRTPEGEMSIS